MTQIDIDSKGIVTILPNVDIFWTDDPYWVKENAGPKFKDRVKEYIKECGYDSYLYKAELEIPNPKKTKNFGEMLALKVECQNLAVQKEGLIKAIEYVLGTSVNKAQENIGITSISNVVTLRAYPIINTGSNGVVKFRDAKSTTWEREIELKLIDSEEGIVQVEVESGVAFFYGKSFLDALNNGGKKFKLTEV